MNIYEVAFAVVRALNELNIPYLIVGGIATMYHGYSRTTEDVDFVIGLDSQERLPDLVKLLGPAFVLDPQVTFAVHTNSTYRTIQLADSPIRVDFFFMSDDPFDREQFSRRLRRQLLEHPVYLPTAEDVIIAKLRWQRPKDLVDATFVMGVQLDVLDWAYTTRWCDAHGTRELLEELRRKIPPL
jgi:Nucleotidyl transferase AbiEii toxin, Type IV TA system